MATPSRFDRTPVDPLVRGFFHAIKDNPDDDTPRLIFADWLQEHGNAADAARGEFLRLSVLRHRMSPDDPDYELLKRREGELFTEHCWTWLGPLMDAAKSWTFERGMIQIAVQARKIMNSKVGAWARTPAGLWVDVLALHQVTRAGMADLAYSPLLDNVNCLDLSDNICRTDLELLFRALRAQRLRFLKSLCLARCRLGPEHLHFSDRSRELLNGLAYLDLSENVLNDTAARLLAESPYLKNVAELCLGRNSFTLDGLVLLRQEFGNRVRF